MQNKNNLSEAEVKLIKESKGNAEQVFKTEEDNYFIKGNRFSPLMNLDDATKIFRKPNKDYSFLHSAVRGMYERMVILKNSEVIFENKEITKYFKSQTYIIFRDEPYTITWSLKLIPIHHVHDEKYPLNFYSFDSLEEALNKAKELSNVDNNRYMIARILYYNNDRA